MFYRYRGAMNVSRSMQSVFSGLNKNPRISDSEFAAMTNMTGDNYPLLSPRQKRTVVQTNEGKRLNGILGDVGFCAIWDGEFHYMGARVDGIALANGEKKLVTMGTRILIFPDAVVYDTASGDVRELDEGVKGADHTVSTVLYRTYVYLKDGATTLPCNIRRKISPKSSWSVINDNNVLRAHYLIEGLPETLNGTEGTYAPMSITGGKLYYMYSADWAQKVFTNIEWKEVPIDYVEVPSSGSVLTGLTGNLWCGDKKIDATESGNIITFKGHSAFACVDFTLDESKLIATKINGSAIVSKTFPVFDYVCVHGNRLWGCRYGEQINGETVNEIYFSALGDPFVWTSGTGAGDAFAFSVGEYGKWTGCASVRGHLLFFKEDCIYRVTGDRPSNVTADVISDNGLQENCEKTLEVIDNVLYYKSRNGVYVYDGGVPYRISDALGSGYYDNAVAGKHLQKYYITMAQNNKRQLYVYDTVLRLWHAEDDAYISCFAEYDGALYAGINGKIVCIEGNVSPIFTEAQTEGDFEWSVETGDIGLDSPYQKYYRRILVRMDIEASARVSVELCCNSGQWYSAADFTAPQKQSFVMPIITERCDHMRIRIRGKGMATVYSVSFETEAAGDRFSGG